MSTRLDHSDDRSRGATRHSWITYLALTIIVPAVLYPIVQLGAIALRSPNGAATTAPDQAKAINSFGNFGALLEQTPFLEWLASSALFALAVTVPAVALAAFAGYALSRSRSGGVSFGSDRLFILRLGAATMLLVPLYLMLMELRLINVHVALIVLYTATVFPFSLWQAKRRCDEIPLSLEEAARMDGCSRSQSFRLVVLPLVWPLLVILSLLSFVSVWTEYLIAAIALQNAHPFTSPTLLAATQPSAFAPRALYAAGALLVSIPAITLLLILRYRLPGLRCETHDR